MAGSPRIRQVRRRKYGHAWNRNERFAAARDRMLTATKALQMGLVGVDVLVYEITEYMMACRFIQPRTPQ